MCRATGCTGEWRGAIARRSHHGVQYGADSPGRAADEGLALRHSRRGPQDSQPRCTDHSCLQAGLIDTSRCFLRGYSIIGSGSGFTVNLDSDSLGKSNDLGVSSVSRNSDSL